MNRSSYDKTMAFALRLLAAKPRSRAELRERLGEKCDDDAVAEVISRLEELGYVDDKKFAASFAATRIATRPLGRVRLRRDLQRRKVSGEVAESAMNEVYGETNEETLIEKAIAKAMPCRQASERPESGCSSNRATAGSPTQPRAKDASVIPSWQADR